MTSHNGARPLSPASHTPPIGCYSPGIEVEVCASDRLVFVTGQVASDHEGRVCYVGDAAAQTTMVFSKIESVLREADAGLQDLVMVTIFVCDRRDIPAVSRARDEALSTPAPASTLVVVAGLAIPGHLVEINGIALIHRTSSEPGETS